MMQFTIDDFKGKGKYNIMTMNRSNEEVYVAVPEKAIADIASEFRITLYEALAMLSLHHESKDSEVILRNNNFWIEEK